MPSTPNRKPSKPISPWHAVEISARGGGCAASEKLHGVRFLSREAPRLPLRDCDNPNCRCVYVHREDRRAGPRRDEEGTGIRRSPTAGERRVGRGRRKDD